MRNNINGDSLANLFFEVYLLVFFIANHYDEAEYFFGILLNNIFNLGSFKFIDFDIAE